MVDLGLFDDAGSVIDFTSVAVETASCCTSSMFGGGTLFRESVEGIPDGCPRIEIVDESALCSMPLLLWRGVGDREPQLEPAVILTASPCMLPEAVTEAARCSTIFAALATSVAAAAASVAMDSASF